MEIKFNYIAAGKDGSRQNGSLTAQNEVEARAKLHSMGFSVLKLTSEGSTSVEHKLSEKRSIADKKTFLENKNSYEFLGFKTTGEEVNGNIEAKNEIFALKRLSEEYKFNILWLVESNLSPAIKEHKKKGSIDRILGEAFDEGISIDLSESGKKELNEISFISEEEKEAIEEDIKKFVTGIKNLIKNCNGIISGTSLSEVQKEIAELEKIQKSNNISLIQSDLENLLKKVSLFFNDGNKEDLASSSIEIINEINSYLGTDTKDFITKNVIPVLEKFSFLKDYLNDFKKYLDSKDNSELIQKKNNLKRYVRRLFHHLKLLITSSGKEDRRKRLNAIKKTIGLIGVTYKSYSSIKDAINKNKKKYYLEFRRGNKKLYKELRFISSLVMSYYFIYFIFIDFGIRKGIFVDYKLGFFTIGSGFILTFLFTAFIVNFFSLIKIKYFLKNIYFNLFFGWPIFIFLILIYYVNIK